MKLLAVTSTVIVLNLFAGRASIDKPRARGRAEETRSAVIHYLFFDREPILPYPIRRIEMEPNWRYEFSRHDTIELYQLLRNQGKRAAFNWRFTRLIVDKNPWGPKTLVQSDGHVKMGSREYRLTADQLARVRKFIFARIPPPLD